MIHFVDLDHRTLIELPGILAARMHALTRKAYPNETGGIIIGCYDDAHQTALVRCVTGPPRDSVSGRSTFRRGIRGLDAVLARAWLRGLFYLGEWHFHTEAHPTASWIDEYQMAEFARTATMHCPEPVLLIAGLPDFGEHFAGYVYRRSRLVGLRVSQPHIGPTQYTSDQGP